MLLLDLAVAFPSVSRRFLVAALRAEGFSPGVILLIEALYEDNELIWQCPPVRTLCFAMSGVAEGGRPMSSAHFVEVMDPVLRLLREPLRRRCAGMARACADLAVVLRSARLAGDIAPVFHEAHTVAGQRLHTVNCKALVIGHGDAQAQTGCCARATPEEAPEWHDSEFAPMGKYVLGHTARQRVRVRRLDGAAREVACSR